MKKIVGFAGLLSALLTGPGPASALFAAERPAPAASTQSVSAKPQETPSKMPVDEPTEKAVRHDWSMIEARLIPVQNGGRIKPLDSLARESTLFVTGSRKWEGWDPLDLMLSWISFPRFWQNERIVQVTRLDVRRQLNLDETRTRFSPAELFGNPALAQYANRMETGQKGSEIPGVSPERSDAREQELKRVLERLGTFRDVVSGSAFTIVPRPQGSSQDFKGQGSEGENWQSLASLGTSGGSSQIRGYFGEMIRAYLKGDSSDFERFAKLLHSQIEGEIPGWDAHQARVLTAEVLYNRLRPFQYAWIFYLGATLFWLLSFATAKAPAGEGLSKSSDPVKRALGRGKGPALFLTLLAFAIHVFGFALRCFIAGRPPVTNMYESIVWVMLGTVVFAFILYLTQRQAILLVVASSVATAGMIAADAAPAMLDPGLHPLVPVLRSNYWLTIHVLTITLGYAAFALTLGLSNVTLFHYLRQATGSPKGRTAKIDTLNQLTYRAMMFGVVLLAAGTILGGVWADASWGRFWGWDPKETWALIALLCYLTVLHGRYTQWVGQFGYAAWTVVCFLSVLMAWYGVNFVLGVGLHSYGFSNGGLGYVSAYTGAQLLYVLVVAFVRKRSLQKGLTPLPAV